MTRPVTCYERDETPCTDLRCKSDGCRLAKQSRGVAQAVGMPWPSREVVAREIRRAMLDNPTTGGFNERAEKREAIANDAADAIIARFSAAQPPAAPVETDREPLLKKLRFTLQVMRRAHADGKGKLMSVWEQDLEGVEEAIKILSCGAESAEVEHCHSSAETSGQEG